MILAAQFTDEASANAYSPRGQVYKGLTSTSTLQSLSQLEEFLKNSAGKVVRFYEPATNTQIDEAQVREILR